MNRRVRVARGRLAASAAVLLLASVVACESLTGPGAGTRPEPITELPRSLTDAETTVLAGSNVFGLDLLQQLLRAAPDETHLLSPLSASMALAMTMNGAAGETWEGMGTALRLEGLSQEEVNASYRELIDLLRGLDPAVTFELGNSIWHRPGMVPDEAFLATVREAFDATVEALDFSEPGAAKVINQWVADRTRGRIQGIVPDPIPGNVVTYLLNALYFQGDWTDPFDPERTAEGPFHLPDGRTETVSFMDRTGEAHYRGTGTYQAVELPYGAEAFAMTVIVPTGEATVAGVLEELAAGEWESLVDGLRPGQARVLLPRFELEWEAELNDPLADLGMALAFTPAADFSRMFPGGGVWIGEVKQKTFVRMDEVGTEAAAVTSVAMVESAPPEVRADRPFLFAIRERISGTILFLGAVLEAPIG